jgi:hypothetical protein
MQDLGRILVFAGVALLLAGGLVLLFSRLGVSRLPGDLLFRRGNFTFYFPLATSIIVSIVLTLLLWLFRRS